MFLAFALNNIKVAGRRDCCEHLLSDVGSAAVDAAPA
jgi:hypothetical protein